MSKKTDGKLEKIAATAQLYDCYAGLLTEKQATALRLFYEEDLSLSEIAEESGGSRQSVHESIQRGEELLLQYERVLGLAARRQRQTLLLSQIRAALRKSTAEKLLSTLTPLLDALEEEI
ncbi:MAG: hypothetical protein K6B40_01330 [Firmicutes bacterium]|nr:hypothetical protein [Bacillota bacterium]